MKYLAWFGLVMTIACDDVFDATDRGPGAERRSVDDDDGYDRYDDDYDHDDYDDGPFEDCIDPDPDGDNDVDDCVAGVYVTDVGSWGFDADWLGDATSLEESFTWTNRRAGAEISVDIERPVPASSVEIFDGAAYVDIFDGQGDRVGSFELVADPDGYEVDLDDVATGAPGDWTIIIALEYFSGTGSISVSSAHPGDL